MLRLGCFILYSAEYISQINLAHFYTSPLGDLLQYTVQRFIVSLHNYNILGVKGQELVKDVF